jgi:hypothetical protein
MVRTFSSRREWLRRKATRCALLAALVTARAPSAWAQEARATGAEQPTDEDLIARGVALRKLGQDADALATFVVAYALRPSARAAAQIGLARQALGQWIAAERALLEALRASDDAWIAHRRTLLEQSLSAVQAHLGWLNVDSNVDEAEVWVAGELRGHVPTAGGIRVPAGEVEVTVQALPRAPLVRTLHVEANSTAHASFAFPTAPQAAVGTREGAPPMVLTAPPDLPRSNRTRTAGWIALGGSAGLALLGTASLVTREIEASIYNDDARCGPMGGLSRYQRCGTNRDIGSAAQGVAIGAYVGAGVAAVVSTLLLLRRTDSTKAAVAIDAGCDVAGPGLLCRASF